eukprot:scaffold10719_cov101-Isochrysis_galbana.AAC.2
MPRLSDAASARRLDRGLVAGGAPEAMTIFHLNLLFAQRRVSATRWVALGGRGMQRTHASRVHERYFVVRERRLFGAEQGNGETYGRD